MRTNSTLHQHNLRCVASREDIDPREGSVAAKFFRRSMLAQGSYQVDSACERIRAGPVPGPRQLPANESGLRR